MVYKVVVAQVNVLSYLCLAMVGGDFDGTGVIHQEDQGLMWCVVVHAGEEAL